MARTIQDIQTQITTTYVANMADIGITVDTTTWSKTNLMRLFIYVVAFSINVLEQLFDIFKADVNTALAQMLPHTLQWYANKAVAFQYGFDLLPDSDVFDNTGKTDDEIAASKIVTYAAVVEQTNAYGRVYLRMKIAATNGTDLVAVSNEVLAAFVAYMQAIKDAGVALQITTGPADSITQTWRIFYNPLVLNQNGAREDGTSSTPVQDAIKTYLTSLPFNGIYDIQKHVDAVQAVDGVKTLKLDACQTKYGNFPYTNVDVLYTPDAGYLRFADDTFLQITFIPYNG